MTISFLAQKKVRIFFVILLRVFVSTSFAMANLNNMFVNIFTHWKQHVQGSHMCTLQEICELQKLSQSTWDASNAREDMETWLAHHENRRFPSNMSMSLLHEEYNASRIMRLFLRAVLCEFPGAVIAGGFAASKFLQYAQLQTWRTNDIDIFVSTEEEMQALISLYDARVVEPLGHSYDLKTYEFSDISYEECRINREEAHPPKRRRIQWPNINSLRSSVLAWIDGYPSVKYSFPDVRGLDAEEEYMLHQTLANLPDRSVTSNYKIVYTLKMDMPRAKIVTALPVNLILMEPSCPKSYLENRARYVCSNFDITLCSVALKEIDSELVTFRFSHYKESDSALREKKLVLTRTAFHHNLPMQMRRILKYLRRGYRW